MANDKFREMWNILKENDFQIDLAIKSKVTCTSCKNIMIKPCNVPCGCRYCYDCLKTYLDDEEKVCLGESDYCKSELINIDKNVFIDQVANIEISKIIAQCPRESCGFSGELRMMADHMRTCDRQPVACPYQTIGCDKNEIVADKLKEHFIEENLCHARLLMDFVENWRNEMKLLKTNVLDLQEENKCIKEQMESKQVSILALEENAAKLLDENRTFKELETRNKQTKEIILAMQMKSKEQNEEMEKNKKRWNEMEINQEQMRSRMERIIKENASLREELEVIKLDHKAKEVKSLQTKSEKKDQEIGKMKEIREFQDKMGTRIEELFLENKSLKNELETAKQKMIGEETILTLKARLEEQEQGIKKNTEETESWKQIFDEKCDQVKNNQEQMEKRINKITEENAEFLWCIENWKEKMERARNGIETEICSEPFYSHKNGYKMGLSLFPNGNDTGENTHLSLFLCIMQGEFDNILQWPFRHEVKLELLNQNTGLPHFSRIPNIDQFPECSQKPCSEENDGIGSPQFIKLSELSSNAALCQNNQIWIRAVPRLKP